MLLNDGGGRFSDASATHLPQPHRATLEAVLVDLDDDGDRDLLLGNFFSGMQALANDGSGRFTEATAALLGAIAQPRDTIGLLAIETPGAQYLYEAGFFVPDRLFRKERATASIDPRHSGLFRNEAQSGHGMVVNVTDTLVLLAWFTYDRDGRGLYLIASAARPAPGNPTVVLNATLGRGMRFGEFAPTPEQQPWGELRWTVIDCDHAILEYDSALLATDGQPYGSGRIEMSRLVRLPGLDCSA